MMRIAPLVVVAVLSVSCEVQEREQKFPSATPETNAGERLSAEDMAVYDAVVRGYAESGEVLGRCASPPPDRRHPLSAAEIRENSRYVYLEPFTQKFEAESAEFFTPPPAVPPSARTQFLERNHRRASTATYRPRDFVPQRSPNENHVTTLSLTLPGYSLPRTEALVCVLCAMDIPFGGGAQYVHLRKQNGAWRMVQRVPMWIQ
jgi:hypothetical protein